MTGYLGDMKTGGDNNKAEWLAGAPRFCMKIIHVAVMGVFALPARCANRLPSLFAVVTLQGNSWVFFAF